MRNSPVWFAVSAFLRSKKKSIWLFRETNDGQSEQHDQNTLTLTGVNTASAVCAPLQKGESGLPDMTSLSSATVQGKSWLSPLKS